ncbi:MAG: VOC family protein [Candidatus Levybacteria bacterium]|nr:VOC family protein [Candidatus Levybacteria bacterium]
MILGLEAVLLFSQNSQKLADFYKDKVGLKQTMEMEIGEGEKGFSFDMKGSANLYIMHHSKVNGKNNQPERIMFNLEVDDIEKEVKRLKDAGVKLIADIYHVEEYGMIATFEDVDGNYFQFVKTRE